MEKSQESGVDFIRNTAVLKINDEVFMVKYNSNAFVIKPQKIMYKVWAQGYSVSGNRGTAFYYGECLAYSFIEACEKLCHDDLDRNKNGSVRLRKGRPSIWGCALFDNEIDARKFFG